jgi:hypothetical protein
MSFYRRFLHVSGFLLLLYALYHIYGYGETLNLLPYSAHQWRQADCLSFVNSYYYEGFRFFKPAMLWLGTSGNGRAISEFPVLYYLTALLWKISGTDASVLRIINITIVFTGLALLQRSLQHCLKDFFWASFIPLLLFCSPVLVYYTNNFMANAPAFGFSLIAWSFFIRYACTGRAIHIYLFCLFFLAAGLLKISAFAGAVLIFGVFLLEKLGIQSMYRRERPVFLHSRLYLISLSASVALLVSWTAYAVHYNSLYKNKAFLLGIMPLWETGGDRRMLIWSSLYQNILPFFHNPFVLGLTFLAALLLLLNPKRVPAPAWWISAGGLCSFVLFVILWFDVFDVHDYYLLDQLLFPGTVATAAVLALKAAAPGLYRSARLKTAVLAVLCCSVYYTAVHVRIRYSSEDPWVRSSPLVSQKELSYWGWYHWDYNEHFRALETITPYLRSLGIQREDRVLSLPDNSLNITLLLMNQKGYTNYHYNPQRAKDLSFILSKGVRYVIVNRETVFENPYLKPYLRNKIGQYKNVSIFRIY